MSKEMTDTQANKEREKTKKQPLDADANGWDITNAISTIYGGLKTIQGNFNDCVMAFRTIQNFDKDLQAVIGWHLPAEVNRVSFDECGVCDPALSDEGYAQWMVQTMKASTNVSRLNTLAALMRMLDLGIRDLRRKSDKLTERVRLQGNNTTEGRAAALLNGKVEAAIKILKLRQCDVADRFYMTRKRVLEDVAALSRKMADNSKITDGRKKGKYEPEVIEKVRKHSVADTLADIKGIDDSVIEGTSAKYKYNPFMA